MLGIIGGGIEGYYQIHKKAMQQQIDNHIALKVRMKQFTNKINAVKDQESLPD